MKKRVLRLLLVTTILLGLMPGVFAQTTIATDDFECDAFTCGSGWNGDWVYTGDCTIATTGSPIDTFHLRGQEDASGTCIANRSFDSTGYSSVNLSFWARADVLETGDFCRYYYYNGVGLTELLSLTDGDDGNPYELYSYEITQHGISSTAALHFQQFGVGADNCYIDNISIEGFALSGPAPNVTSLLPVNGSTFNVGDGVEIGADVVDEGSVSSVTANVTLPNGTVDVVTLNNAGGAKYNVSYVVPSSLGRYDIRIIATDNDGVVNASETTYFDVDANFTYVSDGITSSVYGYVGGVLNSLRYVFNSLQLDSALGGVFTSQIFDSGSDTTVWSNLTWTAGGNYGQALPGNGAVELGYGGLNMSGNLLLLHFDEIVSSTSFTDTSGGSHTFSCVGTGCPVAGEAGRYGNALDFDGDNDRVVDQDPTLIEPVDQITMEAWIYWRGEAGEADNLQNIITNGQFNRALRVTEPDYDDGGGHLGNLSYVILNVGATEYNVYSTQQLTHNAWHYVAATYNGTSINLYVDGQLETVQAATGQITAPCCYTAIGAEGDDSNYNFYGLIDEAAIYNRSLSDAEILARYERGATALNVSVRSCDDASCSGESFAVVNASEALEINETNRYFQYQLSFASDNESVTLEVYNISIGTSGLVSVTNPPSFSNFVVTPSNGSAYTGGLVMFNVTVSNETMLDTVGIEINGVNYSTTNNGEVYSFNQTLGTGTYSYYWWANDSDGNYNVSLVESYTVTQATSSCLSSVVPSSTITYGTQLNVSGDCGNPEAMTMLYRDGVDVTSELGTNVTLGAGTYTYELNVSGTQNYTSDNTTFSVTVSQAVGEISLLLNGAASDIGVIYPQETNYSATTSYGSVTLLRDGLDITSENGLNITRGVGYYNITAVSSGDANHTGASVSYFVDITPATSTCTLTVSPSSSVVYGTAVNVSGACNNLESSALLYRDDSDVSSELGSDVVLGAGSYDYVLNVSATQNYTDASDNLTLSVTQADGDVTLLLNGAADNITLQYPAPLNVTASTLYGAVTVYREGVDVGSELGSDVVLGVGTYNLTAISNGDANHTETSTTYYVTVTPATTQTMLYLNGSQDNITLEIGNSIPINASVSGEDDLLVYLDGAIIFQGASPSSNTTTFNNAGVFNVTALYQATQNYTASSETFFVTVVDSNAPIVSLVSPTSSNYTAVQISLNYTVFDDTLDSCWYSLDNGVTNVSVICGQNVTGLDSGEGISTWTVYANDSAGSDESDSVTFFVDSIAPVVSYGTGTLNNDSTVLDDWIYANVSVTEVNEANITFSLSNASGVVNETTFTGLTRSINWTGLAEGEYYYQVFVSDILGNVGNTEVRTINLTSSNGPTVSIVTPLAGTYAVSSQLITITSTGVSTWFFNGTDNETYTVPVSRSFSDGVQTILAYANDSFGVVSSDSVTFTIDTTAPVWITVPTNETIYENESLEQTIVASDALSSLTYFVNDSAFSINASGFLTNSSALGVGNYSLTVGANDSVGNVLSEEIIVEVLPLPTDISPVVHDVFTLVDGVNTTPVYGEVLIVQLNVSDDDSAILNASIQIGNPNGTVVTRSIITTAVPGSYVLLNSSSVNITQYGLWNWSYVLSDGTSNLTGSGDFEVLADLFVFPGSYSVTPDPKNETLVWNLSMYHQSYTEYNYSFSYMLNDTYFVLNFTDLSAMFSVQEYNTTLLYQNQITITTNESVLEDQLYLGNITITRLLDGKNYTVPIEIGVDTPTGEIDALNSTGGLCSNGDCDYDVVMENDETQVLSWRLSNTGNNTITMCYPNVTGFNYAPFGTFDNENFSLGIGENTTLSLTLTQPSINTFYGQLEVTCQSTSLGYLTRLSSEPSNTPAIKLLVLADSGSPPPTNNGGSSGGGGGGGGGSGGSSVITGLVGSISLDIEEVPPLTVARGESDLLSVNVVNDGTRFLNGCSLVFSDDVAPFFASTQSFTISSGQEVEFVYTVNVPVDAEQGTYEGTLGVECDEGLVETPLELTVPSSDFEVVLQSAEREGVELIVQYYVEEFSGSDQSLDIEYSLITPQGTIWVSGTSGLEVVGGARTDATLVFELPQDTVGDYTLVFDVNNGASIEHVELPITLSLGRGLTGLAISEGNQRALWTGLIIILALFSLYFVLKFLNNHYKRTNPPPHLQEGRKFITLDKEVVDGALEDAQVDYVGKA